MAKKASEYSEQEKVEALNRQKLESEVNLIEFQKGLGRGITIWGFVVGTLSVVASVVTTVLQERKLDSNELKESTNKIDSISSRLDLIEKSATNRATQPYDSLESIR